MQFELLFLSSLALLASSAVISPLHHHDWSQSDRQFYTAVNAIRTSSPSSLSCTMPQPSDMPSSALPPPSPGLSVFHVAVGRGTQNYTCPSTSSPSSPPLALGALANLYNATCLSSFTTPSSPSPLTAVPPILALSASPPALQDTTPPHPLPASSLLTGHHYFTNTTLPTFNLNQASTDSAFGVYFSEKKYNTSAPSGSSMGSDGSTAVPWLKLEVVGEGTVGGDAAVAGGVKEVYRVNTAGGNAPSSCEGRVGETFEMQYAAEYWFFG